MTVEQLIGLLQNPRIPKDAEVIMSPSSEPCSYPIISVTLASGRTVHLEGE